jgi:Fe-S-cluster containining protein
MKPKQERRRLRELYAKIPTFKCIEGCTDCCGPVPATREERRLNPEFLHTAADIIHVLQKGAASPVELGKAPRLADWAYGAGCLSCPYVIEHGGCAIYDDRPLLCRLYGTTANLPCPHGRAPEKMLSLGEERSLMHSYLELFK